MTRNAIVIALCCLACQCKTDEKLVTSENMDVAGFLQALDSLPVAESSSLRGLEIYRKHFIKKHGPGNDSAFRYYLEFQASLIDTLNQALQARPDFEQINSLVWADTNMHAAEARMLRDRLREYGLRLESGEGMIYITPETGTLKDYFYPHLTAPAREFFIQFETELHQPYGEDGGLVVPAKALADRLAFWEQFLANNPRHVFSGYAHENLEKYRHLLLFGLDNTPAFDHALNKIDREFLNAYLYLVQKYPASKTTEIFSRYLELLEKNDFTRNEAIAAFLEQYSIH